MSVGSKAVSACKQRGYDRKNAVCDTPCEFRDISPSGVSIKDVRIQKLGVITEYSLKVRKGDTTGGKGNKDSTFRALCQKEGLRRVGFVSA